MRKMAMATATLALMAVPAWANDVAKGERKMCTVQVTAQVPCDQVGKSEPVEKAKVEATRPRCVEACLSERAWQLSHSKCWSADSKDHRHSTDRFCNQRCATVCRPHGFPKMGHLSKDTNEWTVFRFGHKDD